MVVLARYDGPYPDGRGAASVACALEAVLGLPEHAAQGGGASAGLVVCLLDGGAWGALGARALLGPLSTAYDVRAVVDADDADASGGAGLDPAAVVARAASIRARLLGVLRG